MLILKKNQQTTKSMKKYLACHELKDIKLQTLQDEFSMTAAKMAEDTVAKRISSLVALAGRVRQLRYVEGLGM